MHKSKTMLLHTCCAPCATSPVERLISQGFKVILFFSNSNIHPLAEYEKRLASVRKLARDLSLELIEDAYEHAKWLEHIKGLENEPERGLRCRKCFEFNLRRTASMAETLSCPAFTTTLTLSRHKPSRVIFEIGSAFPGFSPIDFKKQDGYTRSVQLSKKYGLYRQVYCGCEFSMRK